MGMSDAWIWPGLSWSWTCSLILAAVTAILFVVFQRLRNSESWEKYGVKQADMGKLAITDFRAGCNLLLSQHGDTVGTINGDLLLITKDLNLLRTIMVKDFNNFVGRLTGLQSNSAIEKGLFFLEGQDWKRIRKIIAPSFSTGKLKGFAKTVNVSAGKLAQVLAGYTLRGELIPIKHIAGQYTSEIIARLAFGLSTDCIGSEDDEFTHHSKRMFRIRNKIMQLLVFALFRFRVVHRFLVKTLGISLLDSIDSKADVYFNSVLRTTISERQKFVQQGKKTFDDFLHCLIAAKAEGDKAQSATAGQDPQHGTWTPNPKSMTTEELIGQAMLIIFAGFETTSTTLQFCLYRLARHTDIQEKLYNEIRKFVFSEVPTHEELGQLKYMDQVIYETLRHYPPAPVISRKALETKSYGDITIPKGVGIIIPLDLIMMDARNFPDPEKFDPDRFSEENKSSRDPMAFMPFGYGPRLCIGMRLALLELKLALVHLLRKMAFELNDFTEPQIGKDVKTRFQGFVLVDKPVMLAVRHRKERQGY